MPKLLIHVEAINTAITEDDTNVDGFLCHGVTRP